MTKRARGWTTLYVRKSVRQSLDRARQLACAERGISRLSWGDFFMILLGDSRRKAAKLADSSEPK